MKFHTTCCSLHASCANGDLLYLKTVLFPHLTLKHIRNKDNCAFRLACQFGHLEVAKWIHGNFPLCEYDVNIFDHECLRFSCGNGHLEVAKWLVSEFNLTSKNIRCGDNFALMNSCQNGHLKVVKWIVETFGISKNEITHNKYGEDTSWCFWTCIRCHVDVLDFLIDKLQLPANSCSRQINLNWKPILEKSCREGMTDFVSWLVMNFQENEIPEECKDFVQKIKSDENQIMVKPCSYFE